MSEQETEGVTRVPISGTEIAEGVKVGDESNYYEWEEPEPEEEDAPMEYGGFPWGLLVLFVMLLMLSAAIGAVVSGL